MQLKRVEVKGEYAEGHEITFRGVKGTLSPYDIPEVAIVTYDENTKVFAIEFKYLTPDEPKQLAESRDDIKIYTGKLSGKLYKIEILNQDKENLPKMKVEIVAVVDGLISRKKKEEWSKFVEQLNFAVVRDFLSKEKELYTW